MKYVMYGKGIVWNAMVKLLEYMNYDFTQMDDVDRDDDVLDSVDKIIITAWISPKHEIYIKYPEKLMGELDLSWQILKERDLLDKVHFYCITGTNGKSTTTWIAYNVLKQLFDRGDDLLEHPQVLLHPQHKVMVCGNFEPAVCEVVLQICRDVGLPRPQDNDLPRPHTQYHLVTEISSFMCYQIKEFEASDSIITNLAPDHLNRHGELDDYRKSKIRLFEYTKNNCITNDEVINYIKSISLHKSLLKKSQDIAPSARDDKIVSYNVKPIDLAKTNFIGRHNEENFAAVYCLVEKIAEEYDLEWNDEIFYDLVKDIEPLGNRCRKSLLIDGIQFIDDLHATGTHSQSAALSCVDGELILICGGKEAGEDYSPMLDRYRNKVKAAVIIAKEPTPFSLLFEQLATPFHHTTDMKSGLLQALSYAKKYNLKTILYSPWAKSFDLFKNREERALTFQRELTIIS